MAETTGAPSAASQQQAAGQQTHTRVYQACIPCRRRKVKCDLGPVDNPLPPPCVRCRRESKDCFFSSTRRKRRPTDGSGGEEGDLSDYEVRNGRKRLRADSDDMTPPRQHRATLSHNSFDGIPLPPQPLTPGGSVGRHQPLRRPTASEQAQTDAEAQQVNNETAALLQTAEIYSGHDALNVLFEAAQHSQSMENSHHRTGSRGSEHMPLPNMVSLPRPRSSYTSPGNTLQPNFEVNPGMTNGDPLDPAISQPYVNGTVSIEELSEQRAVKAWSRFRFVRAGWFTAKEGIAYIDYFYKYLCPLTPIMVPNYRDHASHPELLAEEPMLVITLLTMSSRFMKLSGPGAASRPYTIHEKLWAYLQGMIDRMIWGQEQHGGGFCGAGAQPGSDVNPLSRKGLRTLGSIESLMLLTEWHPRALHFPPGDDDDELMIPENSSQLGAYNPTILVDTPVQLTGTGGQRVDSWLEPCWRSDRMCWMLLGNALSLAYEIGVFDETSEAAFQQENHGIEPAKVQAYISRRNHLKELLQIYITQTSGRLGLTSMLPKSYLESQHIRSASQRLADRMHQIGRLSERGRYTGHSLEKQSAMEMVIYFWTEIAAIMESANKQMFPSRRQTRELLRTGEYIDKLLFFQPLMQNWWTHFQGCKIIPEHMRHILTIEYEYSRVYLNSLALQAVVERCTHNTPAKSHAELSQPNGELSGSVSPSKADGPAIPLHTIRKWYGNDAPYIAQVVEACRNVLRVVIDGLLPNEYLKHAPVRTYFRIISVSIILLKTFALGATAEDVAVSLGLMQQAVDAIRGCIVDDVHVGNRFADLCETLTDRIRARFVRMSAATNHNSRGVSNSPPNGLQNPIMPPPSNSVPAHQWGHFANQIPNSPSLTNPVPATTNNTDAPVLGSDTPSNPLYGISTESYDPGTNNISIMPPPNFSYDASTFGDANGGFSSGYFGQDGQDWLALPLDPLFNSYGADVTQTMYGPELGGQDLLDILLDNGGTV